MLSRAIYKAAMALILAAGSTAALHAQGDLTHAQGVAMYPSWSPDGQRIAFMSTRDGNYEIYSIRADGTDLKRLTNNLASDGLPSWSPDGTTIAYASDHTHENPSNYFFHARPYAIFLMDADGGNVRRLTNQDVGRWRPTRHVYEDTQPVWSPDGRQIAFVSDRSTGFREIFLVDPMTGVERQLTEVGVHHNNLVWTPDGARLMYDAYYGEDLVLEPKGGWGVFSIDTADKPIAELHRSVRPVINELETDLEFDAAMSPDGRTIAFVKGWVAPEHDTGLDGLFFADVSDISGTASQRSAEREFWARWSPSGDRIAFTSTRDGHREIYVMDADGSNVRRLTYSR